MGNPQPSTTNIQLLLPPVPNPPFPYFLFLPFGERQKGERRGGKGKGEVNIANKLELEKSNTLKCSMGKERMKGIKGESTETSKLTNIKKMVDTSPTS